MRRSPLTVAAFASVLCAGAAAYQDGGVARLPMDPDRGLDAGLRERLRLVDAAADSWESERWIRPIADRLRVIADLWAEDGLPQGLAALDWIDADLLVAALLPEALEPIAERGAWRIARGAADPEATEGFAQAMAAWRAAFEGEARLDVEVFEVQPIEGGVVTRVRLVALGSRGDARIQHDAAWTCTWRSTDSGLALTAVHQDAFTSATLAGHPAGLFEDVTASVLRGAPHVREQLAPGLDPWRKRIPATLEPGSLGHHGVAVGDVDGDGLEDVYLCQPGGLPNRLLVHLPGGAVRDASEAAGVDLLDYSSSALLLDLDQDGDLDLLVSTATALLFFANDGKGIFEPRRSIERSLATSLAAADYDGDGDLDVYVCSYLSPYEQSNLPLPYHDAENGEPNALLRNDGSWVFTDATVEVGLDRNNRRFSFAAAWADYDADGDQDLYVANDFGRNNLYRNDEGRFADVAPELGAEDVSAGMGVAWGDADGDGWMDLYVTNMYTPAACRLTSGSGFRPTLATERSYRDHAMGNALLLNRAGAGFTDAGEASGTARGRWGWGGIFLDFDDDSRLDLFSPNGFVTGEREEDLDSTFWRRVVLQSPDTAEEPAEEYALGWRAINRLVRQGYSWNGHERDVAFLNLGEARFADVSGATGLDYADDGRAAARVDWDGDGDEDLIVTNRTGPMVRFLSNRHQGAKDWLTLRLVGTRCNRGAIGARVVVETADGRRLVRARRCGEGYLAQSTSLVHFGLGPAAVERVVVEWPGGESEDFGSVAPGRAYVLEQGAGRPVPIERGERPPELAAGTLVPPAPAPARMALAVPLPLPELPLETRTGEAAPLLGIGLDGPRGTGHPLVLTLWGKAWPACRRQIETLGAAAETLRAAGIQVLALGVDQGEERAAALAFLEESGWPFAVGFATEEALRILEVVQGTAQDSARALALPSSFLIDPGGRLIAMVEGAVAPERLVQDLELVDLEPAARRNAAVPFPGRWLAPVPELDPERLARRLAERGLARAAAECRTARVEIEELSPATFQFELGQARQRQGRLDEAIQHFEQARALDPDNELVVRSLAVALHQKGDYARALETYRVALALDPADALTRFNLGILYIALDDEAGAEQALEALRASKSELAETLEGEMRKK